MTTQTVLFIAAGILLLLGCGLLWVIVRGRGRSDEKAAPPEAPAEAAIEKVEMPVAPAVVPSVPVASRPLPPPAVPKPVAAPPPPAPPPPAPAPSRAALPPLPVPDDPLSVTVIMAPRPPPPVVERVLALEPASQGEWDEGVALTLSAAQSASVATSIGLGGAPALYALGLRAGDAVALGRGDREFMRALAAAAANVSGGSRRWLDSPAVTALTATALAGLANERFLEALGDEVRELKTQLAALSPKLAALGDTRLKTLVQDLSRFAREARDNYASALGKAAFRERVDEAADRALGVWRDLVERVDAARQQLDELTKSQRFGEVQVEKALAQLRELNDLQRWQEIAARSLAAAQVLRVVMGELPAGGAADPLASAVAAVRAGVEHDLGLALRLSDCEKGARGDPYVGKGEFEANRAALRKLIARPVAELAAPAMERLEAARSAEALDPGGAPPRRLLIRTSGDTCAMRWGGVARGG
ncbi:MAG TPA: hypothetical protein VNS61_17565 [Caldimonas sp.]|nr:hypothetical protein [Caldimonas sp.]